MAGGSPDPSDVLDIAIIGAGVAGSYAGYRLLSADPRESAELSALLAASGRSALKTELFEWNERTGGRLWSVRMPATPDVPAEMGGMRFLSSMQNVHNLCKDQLKLDVGSFQFADNIQYLRGRRFNFADYHDASKVPYALPEGEAGLSWMELVGKAIYQHIVPELSELEKRNASPKEKLDFLRAYRVSLPLTSSKRRAPGATRHRKPLHHCGFWSLLADCLSIEAYHMIVEASGYWSIYGNCNAYIAILDYVRNYADTSYLCLKDGYQTLPRRLAEEYERLGGRVSLTTRLLDIAPETHRGEELYRLEFGLPNGTRTGVRYARQVILAMPQRGLQLLRQDGFLFRDNPQFLDDMDAVTPQASSKLFLTFDTAWWESLEPPIHNGRSDTDLPLRQCYYFGKQPSGPHKGAALMMASYNDGMSQNFWDTYLERAASGPHRTVSPYVNTVAPMEDERLRAPPEMVEEIHRQLCEMHGRDDIPKPSGAIYHNWVEDPSGGGWYFWNPYAESWTIAPRIRQPIPGRKVFLCGSCYSENQGWVEGALNNTDTLLMTQFGLARPAWVTSDYYLGP